MNENLGNESNNSSGLTSINQLIDNTANELFSFPNSSSATEKFVNIKNITF